MFNDKSYTYVLNSDNTARRLLIPDNKKTSYNNLLLTKREFENLKSSDEKKTSTLKSERSSSPQKKPYKIVLKKGTKVLDNPKESRKVFYNGEVTNHISKATNWKKGLDEQLEQKSQFKKAIENENRRFDEIQEKDRQSFLLNLKCMEDERRKSNIKHREDLLKKIKENAIIREEEINKNKMVPVEKYVLSKKDSAINIEKLYKKYVRDMLDIRRKENDINVVNNAQSELKRYNEMEDTRLDDTAEHIDDTPLEEDIYRVGLQCLKQKQRLDAQMKCAREKNLAEQKRTLFEYKHTKSNYGPELNTAILKKIAEMEQVKAYKNAREKWLEEQRNNEKKRNYYYEGIKDKFNNSDDCKEKEDTLKKICSEIKYRMSLERQMKDQEKQKKNNRTYGSDITHRINSKRFENIKPEDLPEYLWKSQVWAQNHHHSEMETEK
ncbi:hypothetical protein M8J77_008607 [Diaphorina citri]|nr:hypothetical protein M8J77_008607 [Diaphorina citri]